VHVAAVTARECSSQHVQRMDKAAPGGKAAVDLSNTICLLQQQSQWMHDAGVRQQPSTLCCSGACTTAAPSDFLSSSSTSQILSVLLQKSLGRNINPVNLHPPLSWSVHFRQQHAEGNALVTTSFLIHTALYSTPTTLPHRQSSIV